MKSQVKNSVKVQKIAVFSVLSDFSIPKSRRKRAKLHPYNSLSESHREWVLENAIRLMEHPTDAELAFEQKLVAHHISYEKQTFFRINGHDYFLDFYFPQNHVAIEIDGSIHRKQKVYDKFRDKEFSKIGITTIRIHNSEALKPDVIELINSKYRQLITRRNSPKSEKIIKANY